MKRLLRFCVLALVLLAIALASALTAMRFAIHGREVRVPRLTGLDQEQAEQAATQNELQLFVENRFYSKTYAPGQVLSQYPPPNDKVRRGWRVRVALSLGPQRTSVPDVTGATERAAQLTLRRMGFEAAHTARLPSPAPEGTVLAQSPQATETGISSPRVDLLVAAAAEPQMWVMPTLINMSVEQALSSLPAKVLVPSVEALPPPPDAQVAPGTVYQQFPPAGSKVITGATVRLFVAP
ncbi:MAG: hypothetical protein NVS9B15_26090 [Acidobacteriaceae bacterium]